MTFTRGDKRRINSMSISLKLSVRASVSDASQVVANARVTSWGDEVEQAVDAVIPKPGVTLDTRLFGQNIVILAFEMSHDLLETTVELGGVWF